MAAPSEVFTELLREREKSGLFVCQKAIDLPAALAEQADDLRCRAVPQPDPDHFRRSPVKDAEPLKVFILAYDYKAVVARVLPNRTIGTARQAPIADMDAIWIQIRELRDEPCREIFVEE